MPDPSTDPTRPELVWYAGYGSNLDPERFAYYLAGGRPPGARRPVPGARDSTPAREVRALTLPGRMLFGWESPTWGGGVSFLEVADTGSANQVPATGYLITTGQFADVAAQEMHREPGGEVDLSVVLRERRHVHGPGRYETLHLVDEIDGHPVLTFSAHDLEHLPRNAPSGGYLATLVRGLRVVHGWSDVAIAGYLTGCEGAETWDPAEVARLIAGTR